MSKESDGRAALRSILPEEYLIEHRDVNALKYKYRAQLSGDRRYTIETMAIARHWLADTPDFSKTYSKEKVFDGMEVEARTPSPVSAYDPRTGDRIRKEKKDATQLHVYSLAGPQQLRTQLAVAAEYIRANKKPANTKYVAGFTIPRSDDSPPQSASDQ